MTFKANGLLSDSISVKIIDFTGPSITTEPGLPFPSGSNVAFTCMVDTLSTNITFEWDCLGKREPQSRSFFGSKSTKYSSVITRNIQLIHDGETCRCCINVDGIRGNSEISLAISRKPIIDISKAATCESYSTITLYCVIHTGFPLFGFNNWIHSRHGTLIRHLEGEKMHTMSILKFNSCSRDDTGDYTCEAYNRYEGNLTFANKTVSLIVYGPPIIKSEKTVTCYNSSVTLSCNIDTVLPVYGFNPWIHYFNGTFVRSLNGSVQEMKSILEVDTCSYYNAGEYMCAAWNKYGDTALVANKTIVLVVNASPVIISSGVIREQQTILSATFYSTTEVLLTWRQSNQTLTNSTDRLQMLDRKTIELILYNKNIECDGYIANLSIRSSLVGEYVLLIQNTFGTTRLFYEVNKLSTQGPPIIKSEETVTCNNLSVALSCNIDTGLPVYGFNPWIHYFNGTFIRSLNGSVQEMKSILELETCSYQNAGEYMCAAWNKFGDTAQVANKTIVLVVNASPVIISSGVIREQQTILSATFYSTTEVLLTWQQSNQTLTNSTDWLQTLDRKKIELILYNKNIECDGFIANLSIRSSLVGEYVLLIQNTYGETSLFFEVNKLSTQGPPIIKSEETVTCNNSSVTLSCNIDTGLPVYGFNPWIHYFNGTIVRSLNGSVQEMKSTLEVETCSYQNAGAYMCAAWNKYGDTTLVANKTIVLVVNASPVIISSSVIRGQQTLSATFYSTTEVLLTWQQSNQTLTNSTDRLQTLDRKKIELILYNKSIECDGFIANLSIRSSLVGEYVLLITNTFGETRLFFDVNELGTQALTTSYDLRIVVFSIIAIGIFILSTAGTVIVSKGIRRKNVIHIIGPHERCPTIPIYHTAPAFDTTPNVYAIPETGYQQVTNEQYELDNFQDTENKGVENYTSRYMSSLYDEIDV
ncbi:titin-like isoform X2 [Mytilus californianus]|nr:titin-like isoform X2 [Mytilus californianus]